MRQCFQGGRWAARYRDTQTRGLATADACNGASHRQLRRMPETDPVTVITAELIQRLRQQPFEPFVIVLSNGSRHDVPTSDHCTVTRFSRRVSVDHDDGSFVMINPLHIAHIEALQRPAA